MPRWRAFVTTAMRADRAIACSTLDLLPWPACTPETVEKQRVRRRAEIAPRRAAEDVASDDTPRARRVRIRRESLYAAIRDRSISQQALADAPCATNAGSANVRRRRRRHRVAIASRQRHAKAAARRATSTPALRRSPRFRARPPRRRARRGRRNRNHSRWRPPAPVGLTKLGVLHDEGLLPGATADTRRAAARASLARRGARQRGGALQPRLGPCARRGRRRRRLRGVARRRVARAQRRRRGSGLSSLARAVGSRRRGARSCGPTGTLRLAAVSSCNPGFDAMRGTKQ